MNTQTNNKELWEKVTRIAIYDIKVLYQSLLIIID